jgi:hypothetical protein
MRLCLLVRPWYISLQCGLRNTASIVYYQFGIQEEQGDRDFGIDARKFLVEKFRQIVALFLDERSMVSLRTLDEASLHASSQTAHGGFCNDEDWGGIPIAVMFRDDYMKNQLAT